MTKENPNYWKPATIALGIILILILGLNMYLDNYNEQINLGKFNISQGELNKFDSVTKSGQVLLLCNTETEECITLGKK